MDSPLRGNELLMGDDALMGSASMGEVAHRRNAPSPPRKRGPIFSGVDSRLRGNDFAPNDTSTDGRHIERH
jgi:hypothetical protein